ncbi:MAG: RNA polymerase sigma factor SigZ [Flammeovirgaceae bacterium]
MNKTLPDYWAKNSQPLMAFVRKQVKDRQVADDIMQDVFLKAYEYVGGLQDEAKLKSWLFQVAKHKVIDYFRKAKKENCHIETLEFDCSQEASNNQKLANCMANMITYLPKKYQDPLRLTALEGMSQKDLANYLGISYSGAKSRVQRGRIALRKLFEACCTIELDAYGNVIHYAPKYRCCKK